MKKKIIIIIVLVLIVLILSCISVLIYNNKKIDNQNDSNKIKIYKCYNKKDQSYIDNNIIYIYNNYYQYSIDRNNNITNYADVRTYKLSSENDFNNFDIQKFEHKYYDLETDHKNLTYIYKAEIRLIDSKEREDEDDLSTFRNTLKSHGYTDCIEQ